MEITKKELKSILTEQRKEFERYTGILAEEFGSQVKIVAETLTDVQKQLVALREMVAKNTEDIEMTRLDIHLIKQDLKQKVDRDEFFALDRRVLALEAKARK